MFIGDRLLNIPSTLGDAFEVHQLLGLQCRVSDEFIFVNACKLVETNNELYDKHRNVTWLQEKTDEVKDKR